MSEKKVYNRSGLPIVRGEKNENGQRITLRNPQIVLLKTIAGSTTKSLTRPQILKKCPGINLSEHLGNLKGTTNKFTISLTERNYVRQEVQETKDGGSVVVISLTKLGLKALEKC